MSAIWPVEQVAGAASMGRGTRHPLSFLKSAFGPSLMTGLIQTHFSLVSKNQHSLSPRTAMGTDWGHDSGMQEVAVLMV